MSTSVRIIVPTRGQSPRLTALLGDLAREVDDCAEAVVRVEVTSAGESAAANRNLGAVNATEDWLQFVDDDVRLPQGWLAALLDVLADPAAPDVLGGEIGSLNHRNWFSQASEDFVVRHKEYPEGWYLVSAHLAVRRTAFTRLGGFDEAFSTAGGEDWDLCRRAHALGLQVGMTEKVACRHANPTSWQQLADRARAYGTASITLDRSARSSGSDSAEIADSYQARRTGTLPLRAARWVAYEYRGLRRQGRSPARALRSTALYVPWMATYLRARRRAAGILDAGASPSAAAPEG